MKNTAEILDEIESLKKEIEILKDQNEIRDILTRYAFRFDLGRLDEWFDLYTQDATFKTHAHFQNGLASIRTYYLSQKEQGGGLHIQLTGITKVEGDQATEINFQLLGDSRNGVEHVGAGSTRRWTFEKENGKWRIKTADSSIPEKFPVFSNELVPLNW
jgi:hypothetical protein